MVVENKQIDEAQIEKLIVEENHDAAPPVGFEVIRREFVKDKIAMAALVILAALVLIVVFASFFIDLDEATRVDIFSRFTPPGEDGYILGSDEGGRDVFALLIVGARNSLFIGWSITVLTAIIGLVTGIISGYYGGIVDDIMMRIVDFVMVLPQLMIIIVVVTIMRTFNAFTLIWVLTAFAWVSQTRLFRTATLSEASKDYISASKTLGTRDWKVMFVELMPNLSSLIITNLTLSFAANIGIETGLSFLGFGLPVGTPSLGTLIGYANNPDVIENKTWVWLPAVILILIMMLCINYIGQAMQRAADSKQRRG